MAVIIAAARETAPGERRVALTPETCKKLVTAGAQVRIVRGLGDGAHFPDQAYVDAGAKLVDDSDALLADADLVLCVQPPSAAIIARMKPGAILINSARDWNGTTTGLDGWAPPQASWQPEVGWGELERGPDAGGPKCHDIGEQALD